MVTQESYSVFAESDDATETYFVGTIATALQKYAELTNSGQWKSIMVVDVRGKVLDEAEMKRRQERPRKRGV